eukprot:COSAG02_NODE_1387_length_12938_cov_24.292235_4_plen_59_part_00
MCVFIEFDLLLLKKSTLHRVIGVDRVYICVYPVYVRCISSDFSPYAQEVRYSIVFTVI